MPSSTTNYPPYQQPIAGKELVTRPWQLYFNNLLAVINNATGGGGGGSTAAIIKQTTKVGHQNLLNLPTAPVPLVSGAAGQILTPVFWNLQFHFFPGPGYTNIDAGAFLWIEYGGTTPAVPELASGYLANDATTIPVLDKLTTVLSAANNWTVQLFPYAENVDPLSSEWGAFPVVHATGNIQGAPLRLTMDNGGSGNLTGGSSSNILVIDTYYVLEPI